MHILNHLLFINECIYLLEFFVSIFGFREEWCLLKSARHNINKLSISELNSIEFLKLLLDGVRELGKSLGMRSSFCYKLVVCREKQINKEQPMKIDVFFLNKTYKKRRSPICA